MGIGKELWGSTQRLTGGIVVGVKRGVGVGGGELSHGKASGMSSMPLKATLSGSMQFHNFQETTFKFYFIVG